MLGLGVIPKARLTRLFHLLRIPKDGFGDDGGTTPTTKERIEGYLSAVRSLVKEHNSRGDVSPIRLNFDEDRDDTETRAIVTGKEVGDANLKRPFEETVKTLLEDHRVC
ncbi:hypothetical protein Tco_0239769, partial [Tanacetum coccineum]